MSTMQNLKNFIRHGKQARATNSPHGEPTTNVTPVHAQHQRYTPTPPQNNYALSDPNILDHKPLQHGYVPGADYSAANIDNRNVAAQAGGVAAKAAGDHQKVAANGGSTERKKDFDPTVLEKIVAEERESKGKLPKYPGLERWTLVEKMGDGAFSNVYRAKDNTGQTGDVAIKVVRKFEMNSNQVSMASHMDSSYVSAYNTMASHRCGAFPIYFINDFFVLIQCRPSIEVKHHYSRSHYQHAS